MIVDDLDFSSVTIGPTKNQPRLIIDADRMKPFPFAFECFEVIAGRHPEIAESSGIMKIEQFPSRHPAQLMRKLANILALFVIV